ELRGRNLLEVCPCANDIENAQVGRERLGLELRRARPAIILGEAAPLVEVVGQERPAEWTIRDEADTEFLTGVEDAVLWHALDQRILRLKGCYRLNRVCPPDRPRADF